MMIFSEKERSVLLLSMHHITNTDSATEKKREIIYFYNSTKADVDGVLWQFAPSEKGIVRKELLIQLGR